MSALSLTQIPPGGWQYYQSQTGWMAPTPIASTFDQTVVLIIKHRRANPALVTKHNLCIDRECVGAELLAFNKTRLKLNDEEIDKPQPQGASVKRGGCCGG